MAFVWCLLLEELESGMKGVNKTGRKREGNIGEERGRGEYGGEGEWGEDRNEMKGNFVINPQTPAKVPHSFSPNIGLIFTIFRR